MLRKSSFGLAMATLLGALPASAQCPDGTVASPASFSGTIRPAIAEDVNPAADVVEVHLTARPSTWDFGSGNQTPVWTYNGVLPGPTIEAKLGDLLVVEFCNDLPDPTTIHWHGLETPATMDGSHISQLTVPPGGTFRYEIPLIHAGTFWYHPHFQTHRQVEKGLYGGLVVRDPGGEAGLNLPEREHLLILDDVMLDGDGQIREPFLGTREEVALEMLNGREGDTALVNGMRQPVFNLEKRVPHRLRVLNAASSRFMRMGVTDHPFWRIGGDQGLIEAPIELPPIVDTSQALTTDDGADKHVEPSPTAGLLLTPGERADILFFPAADDRLDFTWYDTARGRHSVVFEEDGTVTLAHDVPDGNLHPKLWAYIQLTGDSTAESYTPPAKLADLVAIDTTGATELPLVMGHTPPNYDTGEVTFFIQAPMKPFAALTPEDVHTVEVGGTYIWTVRNLTGGHHNFHTHGWSFQHIETEFVDLVNPDNNRVEPATHLEWKDTFLLPARPGLPGQSYTIGRFAVHFSDTGRKNLAFAGGREPTEHRSGGWLAHCHILEHSARGMMTFFQTSGIFADGFESGNMSRWTESP